MRVLIACETSGMTRDAFRARGHDAWSCDLLPAETATLYHYQCDVRDVLNHGWDLMIAHPDCTYLTVAANKYLKDDPGVKCAPGVLFGAARRQAREEALTFVMLLMKAPIKKKVIENPIGAISSAIRKPDQIIQPFQFGDDASKATCLWLEGVAPLVIDPAKRYPGRWVMHNGKMVERWGNQTDSGQNKLAPSADRWKERARTYPGIAGAFAEQWGQE